MKLAAFLAGLAILGSSVFLTFQLGSSPELGFDGSDSYAIASAILIATLMFLGLTMGCLFRQLTSRDEQIEILKELKLVFGSNSFLSALCVSPFVFMGVYVAVKSRPGDPASMLLAFQNGFFCESVFARMYPTGAKQPAKKRSVKPPTPPQQ